MHKEHKEFIMTVIESSVANLQKHEELINDLNVFPIPDGDTGSNMLATLLSAFKNISEGSVTDVEILHDFARGALLGARGNSGVITSQIIKGLAEGVKKEGGISNTANSIRTVLRTAKEYAYKSVSNPVEGTILSVVKAMDKNYNRNTTDTKEIFSSIAEIANKATEYTPEQLPILKESGVVDSGAKGLLVIIEGALLALQGNPLKLDQNNMQNNSSDSQAFVKAHPTDNIGYCTEFILTLKDPDNFNENVLKDFLINQLKGDSLVLIQEKDILKVHVHVKHPGEVFNEAQKYGEFSKIKADNMASQAKGAGHIVHGDLFSTINKEMNQKELSIIAVSNGEGLNKEFMSLGVNQIISGGQSMNPSVEDFIKVIKKTNYKNIVLLPNNSNIILTANTVKSMVEDKNIFVLPTKTMQQGLVAIYNLNKEMLDLDKYKEEIVNSFSDISEGEVSVAVRDTEMNGVNIKKGQFISIKDKTILISTPDFIEASKSLIKKVIADDLEVITLIYNDDVSKEQLEILIKYIESENSSIEIEEIYGGQAIYNLLIFGEK